MGCAEIERKGKIRGSHFVHKGSVGTEVWRRFRVRVDDKLRYCCDKAEHADGPASNIRSADKSTEPITCSERVLTEVMRGGLPQAARRQEFQAHQSPEEFPTGLRKGLGVVAASIARVTLPGVGQRQAAVNVESR